MCELPDDVTLMQIADEQLPPAEHVRWMEIIQKSPELSKRLAAFQETRALGAPYEAEGKIPDRLLDTIRNTPIGGMAAPSRVETETLAAKIGSAIGALFSPKIPLWGAALASSAALVVGLAAPRNLQAPAPRGGAETALMRLVPGGLIATGKLAAALESQASPARAPADTPAGAEWIVWPVNSFASEDGYCRQFEMLHGTPKARVVGLACKKDGNWLVEAQSPASPKAAPQRSGMRVASGELPAAFENLLNKRRVGDLLGADDEASVLKKGWN